MNTHLNRHDGHRRKMSQIVHTLLWTSLVFVAAFLFGPESIVAAEPGTGFLDRLYRDDAGEHKYVVFVPSNYETKKQWPVILFLHGAGERGTDGKLQTTIGLAPAIQQQAERFPFIVVFPQAEDPKGRILTAWSPQSTDGARALRILETVEKKFHIDPHRRILTGWSMGGYGVWQLAAAKPQLWSAIVPISGGGEPAVAEKVKHLPTWIFHGATDDIVRVEESRKMVAALKSIGRPARYTEYPHVGHNAWQNAYADEQLTRWMLSPTRAAVSTAPLRAKPRPRDAQSRLISTNEPFIPALEIPRAVSIRLGNNMLSALADTIPQIVTRDIISGRVADIYDSTVAEGYHFNVHFRGISYSGELARLAIKAYHKDRLNVQIGMRNVRLYISSTSVIGPDSLIGGRKSANAGPINVVLGHRRPIWLSFDVAPVIVSRKLKLKLVGSNFSIPRDNWYVTTPYVSTHGAGMKSGKVASGLVNGIYSKKGRIEREVVAVIPSLIRQLEEHLDLQQASKLVVGLWPLPVYKPRLRVWPAEISTDAQGVSIVMGVTAAAIDPQKPPQRPKVTRPVGPRAADVPRSADFQIGVAPQLLAPLTNMLVEHDVARIHILDMPIKAFFPLADAKFLAEAIPDLKQYGDEVQVWSELILTAPLTIASGRAEANSVGEKISQTATASGSPPPADENTDAQAKRASQIEFRLPRLLISLAIKTDPTVSRWTPWAEFEFSIHQRVQPQLVQPSSLTRALKLGWQGEPQLQLQGRFAPQYQADNPAMDLDRIREVLLQGWHELTQKGPATQVTIADLDLGYNKLRASDVTWLAPLISATFTAPGVKITNSSDQPLVYETKGPYSGWGGPYTLKPGKSHNFEISYPLIYRRRAERGFKAFTLPVGTHSEFWASKAGTLPQLYQARENIPAPATPALEENVDTATTSAN